MFDFSRLIYLGVFVPLVAIIILIIALCKLATKTWQKKWKLILPFYNLFTFTKIAWIRNKLVPIIWLISIVLKILFNWFSLVWWIFWMLQFFMGGDIKIPYANISAFLNEIPSEVFYLLNIIIWLIPVIVFYKIYKKFNWNKFWSLVGSVSFIFFIDYILSVLDVLLTSSSYVISLIAVIFVYLCRIVAIVAVLVLCFSKKFQYVGEESLNSWGEISGISGDNMGISNKKNNKWGILIILIILIWLVFYLFRWDKKNHGSISYDEDANITYTDTNWKVFTWIGTITITNGKESITLLDRNLWATEAWTGSASFWYHFQWWNNYWFTWVKNHSTEFLWSESLRSWQVEWYIDTTYNSWNNPYISSEFVVDVEYSKDGNRADTDHMIDLWWWDGDMYSWGNVDYKRQWPCPVGYHVPSNSELENLVKMYVDYDDKWWFGDYYHSFVSKFMEDFKIPFAGFRNRFGTALGLGGNAYWWSSSPTISRGWGSDTPTAWVRSKALTITKDRIDIDIWWDSHDMGMSIRCFKDSQPDDFLVISYETNGWLSIQSQSIASWERAYVPWTSIKTWYAIAWWYRDPELTKKWDFDNDLVTGNVTLYAKRWTAYTVTFDTNWWSDVDDIMWAYWSVIIKPHNPTKPINQFEWWYKDRALTEEWNFDTDIVEWDMTLYAKWGEKFVLIKEKI